MFTFPVMSDQEIQEMNLVGEGSYQFEVMGIQDTDANGNALKSQAGNLMIKLTLKFWDGNGRERLVYDYLVSMASMVYKIKHFCESVGLNYDAGQFNPRECIGRGGVLQIIIQKGKKKPDSNEFYPDKNAVKDYIKSETHTEGQPNKKAKSDEPFHDDDIPF